MRGFLIWLIVALASSSMAKDLGVMRVDLKVLNDSTKYEKIKMKQLQEFILDIFRRAKDEVKSNISKLQKDLLSEKLELAKVSVKLERKALLLQHCLYSDKANDDIKRIAKEQADEKLESEAKKELRAKYNELLLDLPRPSPQE
ncbi:uncharacterized protein LOC110183105 [Drosophila serrata]|uniref:uncharacterized protein LOC110183105 n=1 Tax=Drosophila serrata TaxID=7274 RepID=UPI000A1CFAC2|nr:uncharacterized protein LOC110183105 [Drosophila serrata]